MTVHVAKMKEVFGFRGRMREQTSQRVFRQSRAAAPAPSLNSPFGMMGGLCHSEAKASDRARCQIFGDTIKAVSDFVMQSQAASLTTIPLELFLHTVSFIGTDVPARHASLCYNQPTEGCFENSETCIKLLSATCSAFRRILAPTLFRHLRMELRFSDASETMLLMECLAKHGIRRQVESVMVRVNADENAQHLRSAVNRLFSYLNPPKLILIAPPAELGNMLGLDICMADSWVFQIPFQVLFMEQSSLQISSKPTRATDAADSSLFALRPWERLLYNEGSSAKAYSTYEFHNYLAPSLFANYNVHKTLSLASDLTNLKVFSYVAVFPIKRSDGHHGKVFVSQLPQLEHLEIQLAPSHKDSRYRSMISSSPGASASDFWSELSNMYRMVRDLLQPSQGLEKRPLRSLTIRDYDVVGYRDVIESVFTCKHLEHDGAGTWHRQMSH